MWSGAPTVKQRPTLRISGPCGVIRRPIYTGILGCSAPCCWPRAGDGSCSSLDGRADPYSFYDWPMFQDLARNWTALLEALSPLAVDRADAAAATIGSYLAAYRRQRLMIGWAPMAISAPVR